MVYFFCDLSKNSQYFFIAKHDYEEFQSRRTGEMKCHCGMDESWSTGGTCSFHESKPKIYVRLHSNMANNIPISPDGIPMVNLAQQRKLSTIVSKMQRQSSGKSNFTPIPKIAGDRYRPGAWIPYKDDTKQKSSKIDEVVSSFKF